MNMQTNINWIQVTSGQGVDECTLAVKHIVEIIEKEAVEYGLNTKLIEYVPGSIDSTIISALYEVHGDKFNQFILNWQGTVQWVCKSPYRPNHKRKNWFIGVNAISLNESEVILHEKDVKVDCMRASGAGGQHINKTDSAVRVTHVPTGLSAKSQELRSQHLNKKLALNRLQAMLDWRYANEKNIKMKELWHNHNALVRGNPVRVFIGKHFIEKQI